MTLKVVPRLKYLIGRIRGNNRLNLVNKFLRDKSYEDMVEGDDSTFFHKFKHIFLAITTNIFENFITKIRVTPPGSVIRILWDLIHTIIILVLIFHETLKFSFDLDDTTDTWSNTFEFKYSCLIFFVCDIIFNFFTGKFEIKNNTK